VRVGCGVQLRFTLPAADGGNGRLRAIAPWAIRAGPGRSRRVGPIPPGRCPERPAGWRRRSTIRCVPRASGVRRGRRRRAPRFASTSL